MGLLKSKQEKEYRQATKALVKSMEAWLRDEGFPKTANSAVSVEVIGGNLRIEILSDNADVARDQRKALKDLLQGTGITHDDAPDWLVMTRMGGKWNHAADLRMDIHHNGGPEALQAKVDSAANRNATLRDEITSFRDRLAAEQNAKGLGR